MLVPDSPSDTPSYPTYSAYATSDLSQLPHTSAQAIQSHPVDSEVSEGTHPPAIDIDARSDTSMPPLYDASDSESEEDHHHRGYDSMSESDADAYDVEMTLLVDDGDPSDDEHAALPSESAPFHPPIPPLVDISDRDYRRVVIEEVEDEERHRTGERAAIRPCLNNVHTNTILGIVPPTTGGQPASSSYVEVPPHWHPHWHHHPHLHPHPHPHFQPHPHPHQDMQSPHPPHPDGGIRLPNFPAMPNLRTPGQVEGQVPLPGLRTLFQPLIVEAVAQAAERFRTAQGTGGPATNQGPATRPATPIVQVTFDVPVFRIPTDAQTRQEPQGEAGPGVDAQGQADPSAPAAPLPRADNPNPTIFNGTPPTVRPPNPIPNATDAMPPIFRQLFEAAFEAGPAEQGADGPQTGAAPPGWAGLMGLLFGLGLGASHELNREDPVRARKLVKGLEAVNIGLVKRMRKISEGGADSAICAICWDGLLEEDAEITPDTGVGGNIWAATSDRGQSNGQETDATTPTEPEREPEEPLPRIVALPCSHVFHSACLVPWFSRPKQTTCPTCRFNVDPDNLTYEPPRRDQSETRQQQQQPMPPQSTVPQREGQEQRESPSGVVPPPQQATQQQDGRPLHPPPLRRTIFEHTFTIPLPPRAFPLAHLQAGNLPPQPQQPEMRPQGADQQNSSPAPATVIDPLTPMAFQRALQNLRRQFVPHPQDRPQRPPNVTPTQEDFTPHPVPLQSQAQPPFPSQGLQPPPQDGPRNTNGMPRSPGLFQFELPQVVRMPDGTWLWSAPLGGFPTPSTGAAPQPPQRPAAPKRPWVPPPAPGLTLRQRVEQDEREQGLRCDDVSCGLGPSDDDPEPMTDLARVVIRSIGGDVASGCEHTFHPACLVSAERVAGWGPDNEGERERAGGLVEVSCPVCRAVGVVPSNDWEKGVQALG